MQPTKRRYTNADAVYKRLEAYFTSHLFSLGDRVPPERDLAEALNVNRTTLRSAMHRMVKEGMLERHVGRGTFFKASPRSLSENFQRVSLECDENELFALRRWFEPQLAHSAAQFATPAQYAALQHYLTSLKQVEGEHQLDADLTLQAWMAEASGNRLFIQLGQLVGTIRRRFAIQTQDGKFTAFGCGKLGPWKAHQEALIKALLEREPVFAQEAMQLKLDELQREVE